MGKSTINYKWPCSIANRLFTRGYPVVNVQPMAGTLPLSVNLAFLTGEYLVLHPHFIYSPSVKFEKKHLINSGYNSSNINISYLPRYLMGYQPPSQKSIGSSPITGIWRPSLPWHPALPKPSVKPDASCGPGQTVTKQESGRPSGIKETINRFP